MKQLNDIETRVLELISYSADSPTSCEYIANTTGITERTIKKIINTLIFKGVPILGGRGVDGKKVRLLYPTNRGRTTRRLAFIY